jgi:DNA invertase Pin-like site-specific DNA recombinase
MKKSVYAYLRTSNKNSKIALDGDSRDRQMKSIKKFCRNKGWKIEDTFYDCSVSGDNGTDLTERDEWNEMMSRMKSNGIKTFIVSDQTRFSRSILTAEIMKKDCRENEISAFDSSTGNDLAISKNENPEVALINNLLQAISEYDKLKTTQRLQSGRRRAKKLNKAIGGNYSYGSRKGEKKLIHRIQELRNRAKNGRLSLQDIAQRINEEGFKTRKGTAFSRQQIFRITKLG